VEITAHNHGFAVDAPLDGPFDSPAGFGRVEVSHVNLNDSVVEGLNALDIPAFSVQYHPEAAAGPHDASYLFDRFVEVMSTNRPRSEGLVRRNSGDAAAERPPSSSTGAAGTASEAGL
jgi:carbamoyl-phosphate synthase small subunit